MTFFQECEGCLELPDDFDQCEDIVSYNNALTERRASCVVPNKPDFANFSFGDCRNLQQKSISIVRICQVINYLLLLETRNIN